MAEIKKFAKADPVTAANGAVILMEKIWPALEQVDSSSGALGGSVGWTLAELLPIVVEAPADRKTRDEWLRLPVVGAGALGRVVWLSRGGLALGG